MKRVGEFYILQKKYENFIFFLKKGEKIVDKYKTF